MAGNVTRALGSNAENRALRFLRRRGLRLIDRNYRCRHGEIDLLMVEGDTLVVVEVRSRAPSRFGSGAESVDGHKQARLFRTTAMFLASTPEYAAHCVRFDVIAIERVQRGAGRLQWIRDAFRP